MSLTNKKIKAYRSIGHSLKPVVMVAEQGISENVKRELERALNDHELIKVKINAGDREQKKELIAKICDSCHCELIQAIGNMIIIFRAAAKPNPKLSNLLRSQ